MCKMFQQLHHKFSKSNEHYQQNGRMQNQLRNQYPFHIPTTHTEKVHGNTSIHNSLKKLKLSRKKHNQKTERRLQ